MIQNLRLFYLLSALLVSTVWADSHAQSGIAIEGYGHIGQLTIPKTSAERTINPLWGAELTISRQTDGRAFWQQAHGLPQMGLTVRGRSLGNTAVYGYDLALVPFLTFTVWNTKHTAIEIKHGTGLGLVSKHYGAITNPANGLISTAFNAVSLLNLGLLIRGSSSVGVKIGAELSHASNGNLHQPNAGLNTLTFYSGLRYSPGGSVLARPLPAINRRRRQWGGYVGAALGFYGTDNGQSVYTTRQLEAAITFLHDVRFRASGGLEVVLPNVQNGVQVGLKVGEEVLFGHLGIRYQVGTYLYNATRSGPVFEKVGIAYYPLPLVNGVARRFSVGTSIKAHGLRAAFIEANAGYAF